MELVLVRHALPVRVDAAPDPDASPADPGLSARGREQARRLAEFLAPEGFSAIYTSPLRRARDTALPLASLIDRRPITEPGIAEWDAGVASYVPVEELEKANDPRWHALQGGDFYIPGADPIAFRLRVVSSVENVIGKHQGSRIAIVTHSGPINAYTGHILGQHKPFWLPLLRSPGYCSITRILAEEDERRIISINETMHVRDLLTS